MFATHRVCAQLCLNDKSLLIKLVFWEDCTVEPAVESEEESFGESGEFEGTFKLRFVKYFKFLEEGSPLVIL